ncbi:LPS translocon maturation chaperone LptM [Undibacterium sp. SXout20W]|uniref:LPS translocon maturation chaperone LptM n=1 Tax=Undibacterium sp. SXout20W TaxID=3413051 RepID=UPI003BF3C924
MRPLISSLVFCTSLTMLLTGCGARGPLYLPNRSLTNELPVSKPTTNSTDTKPITSASPDTQNTSAIPEKK